jgi:hypothetical protein
MLHVFEFRGNAIGRERLVDEERSSRSSPGA